MSGITGDIKKLFNFKYKARNDSVSDQYHRLFMVKAMLVGAFLTGMSWYKDDVKCIVPKAFDTSNTGAFGPKACWINGFYIYDELRNNETFTGYFGIPMDIGHNGIRTNGRGVSETCKVTAQKGSGCRKMTKKFYLQYQWFPFYLALFAFLYYTPYIMFGFVNSDLITLKKSIKSQAVNSEDIVKTHFTPGEQKMPVLRVYLNFVVKLCYLIVNVLFFVFTNNLLNGEFRSFGSKWLSWSELSNFNSHNYIGVRQYKKPGELLLPVFGFCDVLELGKDVKIELENTYHLVCEISQHVLYHYVLIALWWLIIFGIVLSIIGFIELIARHMMRSLYFAKEETAARRVYNSLTTRESEYLDFLKKKNVLIYGDLVRKLYADKFENDYSTSEEGNSTKEERM